MALILGCREGWRDSSSSPVWRWYIPFSFLQIRSHSSCLSAQRTAGKGDFPLGWLLSVGLVPTNSRKLEIWKKFYFLNIGTCLLSVMLNVTKITRYGERENEKSTNFCWGVTNSGKINPEVTRGPIGLENSSLFLSWLWLYYSIKKFVDLICWQTDCLLLTARYLLTG